MTIKISSLFYLTTAVTLSIVTFESKALEHQYAESLGYVKNGQIKYPESRTV